MRWLAAPVALVALAACGKGSADYTGVANWQFGTTTLADVTVGRCQPSDLNDGRKGTWCFGNQPFKVGTKISEVDLYFDGTVPTSKLIEIQLSVRGCIEDEVVQWMTQSFGPPVEERKERAYWKNSFLWAAALVPQRPGRCRVHLLPLTEEREIARIRQL
ncbi:MAG: hypothetical protein KF773_34345 [Deltaproteobacteria bacterium]|nr:hypothetical protein [Deltaproteobacteria bacterium]MCW5805224.1 hypothetical protein [Deltaproteobacteria bacterium]